MTTVRQKITTWTALAAYLLAATCSSLIHDHRHCHSLGEECQVAHGHSHSHSHGHSHSHKHHHADANEQTPEHSHPSQLPLDESDCAICQFLAQKQLSTPQVVIVGLSGFVTETAEPTAVQAESAPLPLPPCRAPPRIA